MSETMMLEHIDRLDQEGKHDEAYSKMVEVNKGDDHELLWRLARSCLQLAYPLEQKNPKKRKLLDEGHKHACAAYQLRGDDFNVLKWAAAVIGSRTDFLGTKEKIEQGNMFKEILDKALLLNPAEFTLLHMRGRFIYSVAGLSWIERKAATALYGPPPDVTYEEAIRDFTAVKELKPDWLQNTLFLAKAHIANGNKEIAVQYLRQIADFSQQDENDEAQPESLKEVKQLLKKYGKL